MGLSLRSMLVIWGVILSSGYLKGDGGYSAQTAEASANIGLAFEVRNRSSSQLQGQEPLLPPPYLQLPMFQHSRLPLVAKEHFSPLSGGGHEKLPDNIREILLPISPPVKKTRHSGGPRGIVIKCKVNKMEVKVPKRLLGDAPSRSRLAFGTCQANNFTKHYLSFVYDVSDCGSKRMIVNNRVTYSNTLRYAPVVTMGLIRRVIPFTLAITCHFNRFHYSYKIGYKPKIETHRLFKPMKSRKSVFTLTPFDAQWRRLNASDGYAIGRPMYFEAEGPPLDADGRLYIHSCHVTASKSHTSEPRFTVIDNFGCMIDSKTSSQSRFISNTRKTVRFSVDAFVFQGVSNKHLFMHCVMSLGSVAPTESDKSCFYNHKTKRWEELHGLDSVCSCCESTCTSSPTATHKMVSSRAWSVTSGAREISTMSALPPEEEVHEMIPPLWSEKEMGKSMSSVWLEKESGATVSPPWPEKGARVALSPLQPEQEPGMVASPHQLWDEGKLPVPSQSPDKQPQEMGPLPWPEEKQREVMPPLWPEEEESEPESVPVITVTEKPIAASTEVWRERGAEPRLIFEEIFGLD